jgi:hypothetical protein
MKNIFVGSVIGIIIVLIAGFLFFTREKDLSDYESLKNPQLTAIGDMRMLQVEARGKAGIIAPKAIRLLYKEYLGIRFRPKGPAMPAPRARWPISVDTPENNWIGILGLPLPDGFKQDITLKKVDDLTVSTTIWTYGEVAEILHIGPYNTEPQTIERLKEFIRRNNYVIAGAHEEEYLRGPSIFGKGNPDRYYTIIRYPISKTLPNSKVSQ